MDPNLPLNYTDGDLLADTSSYQCLVGQPMYLTLSHLDVTYAVNPLRKFTAHPCTLHLCVLHQFLQYLKASPRKCMFIPSGSTLQVTAFAEFDEGSCVTWRSATEIYVFLGDLLISWKSKKQPTVARSSADTEYHALMSVTSEHLWIRQILQIFEVPICLLSWHFATTNLQFRLQQIWLIHEHSKHVDINHPIIREHVKS